MSRAAAAVLAVLLAGPRGGQSDPPQPSWEAPEYVVKAVFLLNFAKYVEWPAAAFEEPLSPIIVAVLGRDPFGTALEETLKGKAVRNRPLKVRRIGRPRDIVDVHLIFVPRAEEPRLSEVLDRARGESVLVVGEGERFCRSGGALSILIENGKPRIEANPDAAARCDLTIDAKLLKVATIVRTGP